MKANQKYFHLVDGHGQLMPNFITLSNIDSADPSHVRAGNERVVRPRLTDADFFWNQDRKQPLAARQESLKSVVFQQKLGTLHDKSLRVSRLAAHIATQIGGDAQHAERAAKLAKCDLMTAMVGEFPELQGIMGRYYAVHDKEPGDVALALDEQYMPRFAGDQLPASKSGQALAIAEKIDTLVGIFGIGQIPTGDKDPFALRRAALGALRTIIETGLDLDLAALLKESASTMPGLSKTDEVVTQVFDFMMSRLRAYYQDTGVSSDTFEAVLAQHPTKPKDFDARIRAVTAFRTLPEAAALAAANKRIANILKKSDETIPANVDEAVLVEAAEKALASAVTAMTSTVTPLFAKREYEAALKQLASLRPTVDAFFDAVMVNAEEQQLRLNRLALLRQLSALFLEVADLSQLQG
jgi:glycyl-tRNA synthetase beta chain